MLLFGVLLIFFSSPHLVIAFDGFTPESFPDSLKQPDTCGLLLPSYLCDTSGILSGRSRLFNHERIGNLLTAVRETTTCKCLPMDAGRCVDLPTGFTVSVAIVHRMDSNEQNRVLVNATAEYFADTLRRRQRRGQCDDDVLIFLSVEDQVVSTSLGFVTKRYLSDRAISVVTSRAGEHFKEGNYTEGLRYMIESYTQILRDGTSHFRIANNGEDVSCEKAWRFLVDDYTRFLNGETDDLQIGQALLFWILYCHFVLISSCFFFVLSPTLHSPHHFITRFLLSEALAVVLQSPRLQSYCVRFSLEFHAGLIA
ncbi:hypothetical protein Q1695_002925 [Nippostrongylus brasiliensis]|nr:hypothetical protein Q1695_002925 [Nippostrongylus brasiliensis]